MLPNHLHRGPSEDQTRHFMMEGETYLDAPETLSRVYLPIVRTYLGM